MASNSDGSGSNGTLPRNFSLNSSRDYDTLKQQYEKTSSELSNSRRRCDLALNDLDYYREQHRAAMNQLEVSSQDSASLRNKYTELLNDKLRLEQENHILRKQLTDVHNHHRQQQQQQQADVLLSGGGGGDNGNSDALYISHAQALTKLELATEENSRLAKQLELLGQERNDAQREIAGLKQQVVKLYKAHQKVQQQYEEAEKQIVAIKIKANKDCKRLTDDRNATLAEYTLVMSERDQVHKEMEKLSEDLSQALKKNKMLDAENQELISEKQAMSYQLESLRREIASALYERDKAIKECNDLREKFGELGAATEDSRRREQARSRLLDSLGGPGENVGRKDALQSDVRSIGQRQRLDNLDQANQELESLRKSLDKVQSELAEAIQEAEVSKGRRDWAFSERDKIVQERESIRSLCDKMRKERDRAVSELAESLRESDALKKHRNELVKEVEALKDMLETHMTDKDEEHGNGGGGGRNITGGVGGGSDVVGGGDGGLSDVLEIELMCDGSSDLGLELSGGRDDPYSPGDTSIYVTSVHENSIAHGKLKPKDRISRVNDVDCSSVSRRMVMEAIRSSLPVARIVVNRKRRKGQHSPSQSSALSNNLSNQVTKWVHTARLVPGCHGLNLNMGVYISRISEGSLAARDKSLSVGDRILRINEKSMDDIESIHEAMRVLNDDSVDVITVTALKISHPECPNVFTPVRRHKRENRSSQTDEHDYLHAGNHQEKNNNSGAWLKEKIDLMRGRRHPKDSDKSKNKYHRNSSSPGGPLELSGGPEQAIAELDLVLDSYRGGGGTSSNVVCGTVKRAKRGGGVTGGTAGGTSSSKEQEKNGGTWPKARAAAILQPGGAVGSTVVARQKKERPALSLLKEVGADYYRNSTPVPLTQMSIVGGASSSAACAPPYTNRHSVYKSVDGGGIGHFTGTVSAAANDSFEKLRALAVAQAATAPSSAGNVGTASNRLSVNLNSDNSLDYPVHSNSNTGGGGGGGGSSSSCSNRYNVVDKEMQQQQAYYKKYKMNLGKLSFECDRDSIMMGGGGSSSPHGDVAHSPGMSSNLPQQPNNSHGHVHSQLWGSGPRYQQYPPVVSSSHHHPHNMDNHHQQQQQQHHIMRDSFSFEPPSPSSSHHPSQTSFHHTHSPSADGALSTTSSGGGGGGTRKIMGGSSSLSGGGGGGMMMGGGLPGGGSGGGGPHVPHHLHHSQQQQQQQHMVYSREPDLLEVGTFPRKRENQRFRVPSNPSVTSKVSTGSIERSSERGSPMPIFHVEVLSPGEPTGNSGGGGGGGGGGRKEYGSWASGGAGTGSGVGVSGGQHKPLPGELRRVHIDKSNEPLGIQINCPDSGGIFVSTVNDNSLASRVGLQIGDQLLEVCGINMRNATYNLAANVLRQCGNSITMLVQYSPDKYNELEGSGSCSETSSNEDDGDGEATPCNSPKEVRKSHPVGIPGLPPPNSLLLSGQQQAALQRQNNASRDDDEPRCLYIETMKTSNLGISLVGGNAAGIFIHSVQPDSLAYHAGLRTGDQILEYNGCDLKNATAEEAAYELAKPADKVTVLAHYRIDRYNEIKDKPGDSLYVRCGFDRSGNNDMTEPPQLAFFKDDVLYVDNTMFNGVPGQWRAWRLDSEGRRQQCGVIPSKYKVEEELLLRRGADPDQQNGMSGGGGGGGSSSPGGRSISSLTGASPTSSSTLGPSNNNNNNNNAVVVTTTTTSTARRSFFRRKKQQHHQRHSKELASFCSLSGPGWYSDGGSLHEEPAPPPAYQRVERLAYPDYRPVLVLGPLAECVVEKLVSDFPDEFGRAPPETRRCSQAQLDRELADGHLVEYRRRGSLWECVSVAAVRQVSRARLHCMLDVAASSVERLHRHGIFPVVLLIKFKSTKQIREVKDAVRYSIDKLSGKAAKEMFEHGHKLEAEYRHLVTAVVAAGANVAHVCAQVKAAVDGEHRKSQWVPVG